MYDSVCDINLKGNSGNQVQKLADCQAARTKVAHAVAYAKKDTTVEDSECQALWENAAENVFEFSEKE